MSMHLSEELAARLRGQGATPAELLSALRHIGECSDCARHADIEDVRESLSVAGVTHLDADTQLFPYVDEGLDRADLEIVQSHLEICPTCREEVADLQQMRRRQRGARTRRWILSAVAAAAGVAVVLLATVDLEQGDIPARRVTTAKPRSSDAPPPRPHRYPNSEWTRLVSEARRMGRLSYPSTSGALAPPAAVLRGKDSASRESLEPAGIVIDETRPRFSWPSRSGWTYVVLIFDGDIEVASSPSLRAGHWTPERDLPRGRTYTWQVEATRGDALDILPAASAPPAMFHVISEREHAEILEARETFPDDPLLHAVLYARSGMKREAEEAMARVKASRAEGSVSVPDRR